jgi:hypothetical protein
MTMGVRTEATERTLLDALADGVEPVAAWRAYRAAHADVFDHYETTFGSPDRPEAEIAAELAAQAPALRRRGRALDLEGVAPHVAELLAVPPQEGLEAVTFAGWGRALAWCDDESEEPRAFFALERMPDDAALCRTLGAHEVTHLAHFRVRQGSWQAWSVLNGVVAEAVAIMAAATLVPGVEPERQMYLSPGTVDAYRRQRAAIHAEVLPLLDVVDEATYRRLMFPPSLCEGAVAGVNESGYPIAWALTEAWRAGGISIAQAARRTPEQARADLVAVLTAH